MQWNGALLSNSFVAYLDHGAIQRAFSYIGSCPAHFTAPPFPLLSFLFFLPSSISLPFSQPSHSSHTAPRVVHTIAHTKYQHTFCNGNHGLPTSCASHHGLGAYFNSASGRAEQVFSRAVSSPPCRLFAPSGPVGLFYRQTFIVDGFDSFAGARFCWGSLWIWDPWICCLPNVLF